MASFFTRALDKITPWNRGGEVQRRQERKRKEDEEWRRQQQSRNNNSSRGGSSLRVGVANPMQRVSVEGQNEPLKPKPPVNIFENLNKNLTLGKPNNVLDVIKDQNVQPVPAPQPGQVVKPTLKVGNATPQTLRMPDGRKVNDIADTPETVINRGLDRGESWEDIARKNNYKVEGVRDFSQATRPNYGVKIEKPKQSFGNRLRDVFDTNTEADKWRRQEGNRKAIAEGRPNEVKDVTLERQGNIISRTPIIGHVTKMFNTAARQLPQVGATLGTDLATREQSAAAEELTKAVQSRDANRITAAKDRFSKASERVDTFTDVQDKIGEGFAKNDGGLFNTGTLFDAEAARRGDLKTGVKDIVLPTAVTGLDLATLGIGAGVSRGIQEGGKAAIRTQAPNIGKMVVGNYASGDLDARAQGAGGWDPIKSGALNAVLGTAPDIGLPLLGRSIQNRVLPKVFNGKPVNPGDIVEELDEAALSSTAEVANQALRPKPIRVAQNIPVTAAEDITDIPVTRTSRGRPLIKELEGDFNFPTYEELQQVRVDKQRAEANDFNAATSRPDPFVEGVQRGTPEQPFNLTPEVAKSGQDEAIDSYAGFLRDMGEGNGTQLVPDGTGGYTRTSNNVRFNGTAGKRMSKQAWRDEAEDQLRAGKADPAIQKQFDDAADPEVQSMLNKGEQPDAPEGRPIPITQASTIPVKFDETVVPTNLPETPGTVRPTAQAAPMAAKTEAVASQPVVNTPAALPREVQEVLDNPKQFNKRQVASARNQRKLARQMAKTQEDTVSAMERIDASNPQRVAGQPEGFAPTGEFARGKRGNAYQKASAETEAVAGRKEMDTRSVDDLISEIGSKESFSPGDRRRLQGAIENMAKADPDNLETRLILKKLQSKSRTELGQGLALVPRVIRRSASADTLTGRWEGKVAKVLDDPTKMTDADFADIQRANDTFTLARDRAAQFEEQFKRSGSDSDFKAWEEAYKAATKADADAKFMEVNVATRVLKGEKGAGVTKVLDDLKKESDVNTMDSVTASMLSGTATGFRNTFGTELAGVENRVGANIRAKVVKGIFGENVGGYNRKGARLGRKVGMTKLFNDSSRRAQLGGKNPIEWAKNWATTINSGGESSLQSQVYSRMGKYYQNQFKEQGFNGKDLDNRMRHAMLTDPDAIGEVYLDASMKSSGLTGLFQQGQTIEKAVVDYVGRQTDSRMAQGASRLLMRLAVGFPTATTNFLYQSGKRLTMGLPSYLESGVKASKGDKLGAALAFERGLKETGSGGAILGLGAMLGAQDLISGAYPSDPDERARWEREGISENSINIGGNWFPIPQGAGMLGLPLLTGAAIGRGGAEGIKEMYTPKNLAKLLPTDQLQGFLNMASGNGAPQDLKNTIASGIRATTPAGALFNQIAKSLDDTKNDTTTKDFWSNVLDQVYSGIPGVNNAMNIPDKTDDDGNVIKNPNPLPLAFGAASATQGGGEERTAQLDKDIQDKLATIDQHGALQDENLQAVLEGKAKEAFAKLQSGKKLDESEVKDLQEGLVRGVSSEGTDTAYLERGEYDTNLAALKLKRELMAADKSTKPSSLKDLDTAIKRGEVYKDGKVPYDLISEYKSVGVEEWRKMGDPEKDEYDPDMYQKLWEMDEKMAKAGVSYKKGALDKPKYTAKEPSKGRGKGSGSRGGSRLGRGSPGTSSFSSEFGTLKKGSFAPEVQAYDSLDQKSGSVPSIRRVRPNIVHKIGSSR